MANSGIRQRLRGILYGLLLTRRGRPGVALWFLALLTLYGLAAGIALPYFAKPYLERELSGELGVSCTVGRLTVNPFRLRIIAWDVRVPYPETARGRTGVYMLRLERLEVTPSPLSLPYRTLIVDELRLVRPHFSLVRFRDGGLSLQLFFAGRGQAGGTAQTKEENANAELFPLVIHNLTVEGGSMDARDMLQNTSYTAQEINLTVPFASTLLTDRNVTLTPSLSAVVNGKPIAIQGESRPFAATRQTVFTLHTSDLNLADFRGYLRPYTSLELASGRLHTELTLRFDQNAEQAFDFSLAGSVKVTNLILERKEEVVFRTDSAAVEAENVVIGPRRIYINQASFENPEIVIRRNADGVIDWTTFFFLPEEMRQSDVHIVTSTGEAVPQLRPRENASPPDQPVLAAGSESLPLQLTVKEAKVNGGTVVWRDDAAPEPVSLSLESLEARFTDISTEGRGQAAFSLAFGNEPSTFRAEGKATLSPLAVECSASAAGLPVPVIQGYLRLYTSLDVADGRLDSDMTLRLTHNEAGRFDVSVGGNLTLADLALVNGKETVFKASRIKLESETLALDQHLVHIRHALLENPEVVVQRDKKGTLDWQTFFFLPETVSPRTRSLVSAPVTETTPFRFILGNARISGGAFTWRDAGPRSAVRYSLVNLAATLSDVDTEGAGRANFSFSFGKDVTSFSLSGKAALNPLRIEAALSAANLALSPLYPYLPEGIGLIPEGGTLSAGGPLVMQLQPESALQWTGGSAALTDFSLKAAGKDISPLLPVPRINAEAVTLVTARRSLRIGTVTGAGVEGILTRGKDGKLVLPGFLESPSASGTGQTASGQPGQGESWQIAIDAVDLTRSGFHLVDNSRRRQTVLPLTDIAVTGRDFANHDDKRWSLGVSAKPGQGGKLAIEAEGTLAPLSLTFSGTMDKADLRPLSPLLREFSDLRISEASLGGDFSGLIRRLPGTPLGGEFALKGNLGVYGLSLVHKRRELGGWGRMRIANFDYRVPSSGERTCSVESITVNSPRLSVIIDETGVSSLATAFRLAGNEPGAAPLLPETPRNPGTGGEAGPKPGFGSLTIGKISVTMGQANYLDQRVSPPYALKVDQVNATCLNLTLDPVAPTSFVGSFSVNGSPVTASAVVSSLFDTPSGNGTLGIQALDISRFTQYAEKYLGYPLRRGELSMSSLFSIKGRKLSMHNSVLLRSLDLGKKVDSPFAPDMPLNTAVSLLRDPNGDIGLELPVNGNVGDPEFKLGGVVGRVIGSIVLKTMTSPLSIVGDILGGFFGLFRDKGPTSAEIVFPIGEDILDAVAAGTLNELGEELRKRPGITLEVTGIADWNEKNVLIDAWVNKMLRHRKYESLPAAEKEEASPESVAVGPEINAREYSRLLFALYTDLPFVKRSTDPEVTNPQSTRAIMRIIRSRLEIGEKELLILARTRSVAVYHALARGKIDIAARIRLLDPVVLNAEETGGRISSYVRISVKR